MNRKAVDDVGVVAGYVEAIPNQRLVGDSLNSGDRDRLIRVIIDFITNDKMLGVANISSIAPDALLAEKQKRIVDPIPFESWNGVFDLPPAAPLGIVYWLQDFDIVDDRRTGLRVEGADFIAFG